jgi:multisubunit Na+/H+ antiporter MnhG subunit
MATDPVSAAQTSTGKYIYGFFSGMLAILFRVLTQHIRGMMLAILFMNVMAPLMNHYVVAANINRRLKGKTDTKSKWIKTVTKLRSFFLGMRWWLFTILLSVTAISRLFLIEWQKTMG